MAKTVIPLKSVDLLKQLAERFPDKMDITDMPPFERGKKAGVVELLRELNFYQGESMKKIVATK